MSKREAGTPSKTQNNVPEISAERRRRSRPRREHGRRRTARPSRRRFSRLCDTVCGNGPKMLYTGDKPCAFCALLYRKLHSTTSNVGDTYDAAVRRPFAATNYPLRQLHRRHARRTSGDGFETLFLLLNRRYSTPRRSVDYKILSIASVSSISHHKTTVRRRQHPTRRGVTAAGLASLLS